MKIIISNYDDIKNPFYGGGGAYAIHEIAKRLSPRFDVTVITSKYAGSKDEIIDGVSYKRIGFDFAGPKIGQLLFYFLLPFYFKTTDFNLWIENFTPPFSTNFLQLFTKKPVIGLVHMIVGVDMKRKYKIPFDVIENLGLKTYKNFIVMTDSVKKKILLINPNTNIAVIPNGINQLEYSGKNQNKKYILYLGRIEINQKGLDLLLKAFGMIKKDIEYDLAIAGSGSTSELKHLHKLIYELGIKDRVKLQGRVTGQDKENLFLNSVFTIIPSRFETFSIVALESLAYGLPIISFDIEGLSWIPSNSRIKVEPFNIELFASSILKLALNPKLQKKMGAIGKKYAEKNTWDKAFKKYSNLIENLIYSK